MDGGGLAIERKQAESVLWQTVEIYRSLVESLPLNVFRKDEQGRFVFANQRFCGVMRKRLDELVGRTDHDFYPMALADKYLEILGMVVDRAMKSKASERRN